MRLYHSRTGAISPTFSLGGVFYGLFKWLGWRLWLVMLGFGMTGCTTAPVSPAEIIVIITVDGASQQLTLPPGSLVQDALKVGSISYGGLDRVEPPAYSPLVDGGTVRVVRVKEEFEALETIIPFEQQILRNESMPEGETRLIQPGVNGLLEITYRRVYEDGLLVLTTPVKSVVIKEVIPEIVMTGSQSPFTPFPIPGRLVYLLGGNAWLIEGNTGNRHPVVSTGDLDGRIFSLSPDGKWLLFSRQAAENGDINTLWVVDLEKHLEEEIESIDLNVSNVVHFADWRPGSTYTIAFTTVEPRTSAPGWQANNDLRLVSLTEEGKVNPITVELDTNMGGNYGWWGMTYAWSPDGSKIAYARPDSFGLLQLGEGNLVALHEVVPLQTRSDWAWVPGIQWGSAGTVLYAADHAASHGLTSPEESPYFDLIAYPLEGGGLLRLVPNAGMFSYPLASPLQAKPSGETAFQVAYLQAIFPAQSENSRYQVMLMDRDGSNRKAVFPPDGAPGLTPLSHWGVWSPEPLPETGNLALAILYQDNLWLMDVVNGSIRQITGDGLVSRIDWK
jgi:resuscitation-promoting factor RpfB